MEKKQAKPVTLKCHRNMDPVTLPLIVKSIVDYYRREVPPADRIVVPSETVRPIRGVPHMYHATVRTIVEFSRPKVHQVQMVFRTSKSHHLLPSTMRLLTT